jgi:hypothetical protein
MENAVVKDQFLYSTSSINIPFPSTENESEDKSTKEKGQVMKIEDIIMNHDENTRTRSLIF